MNFVVLSYSQPMTLRLNHTHTETKVSITGMYPKQLESLVMIIYIESTRLHIPLGVISGQ